VADAAGSSRYQVVPYDPAWPALFEELRRELESALGEVAMRIEHVGSTSVPGLAAKPVIDIQVSVATVENADAYRKPIEALGYTLHVFPGFEDYPLFERQGVHVHICSAGSSHEARHLAVRDYLRAHPDEARAYEAEKRRVAIEAAGDGDRYVGGKDAFVKLMEGRATTWAGVD
jgi:GrpB-like predicted nucleotidyltransferase (UPF0157 family)